MTVPSNQRAGDFCSNGGKIMLRIRNPPLLERYRVFDVTHTVAGRRIDHVQQVDGRHRSRKRLYPDTPILSCLHGNVTQRAIPIKRHHSYKLRPLIRPIMQQRKQPFEVIFQTN
ncbi:hypothetical protein D3C81_1932980 [compost metagenome]